MSHNSDQMSAAIEETGPADRRIVALGFRILTFVATLYLTVLAILFVFQSSFIFPAPQRAYAPQTGFEAVSLETSDGLELTAHWRPPYPGKPVVVWFHGNASSLATSRDETRLLAADGYGLLLAPYRGYGGNPGEPSEQGFYRDGRAALQFLAGKGVEPRETIIAGNSIGSGTATQMASEFDPAALILVSPFSSLPDVVSEALPFFPVRILLRDSFDNASKLPSLRMPILILHGNSDEVVPFELGQRLAQTNDRAEFVPFDDIGHDLSFWREAQEAQLSWLSRRRF